MQVYYSMYRIEQLSKNGKNQKKKKIVNYLQPINNVLLLDNFK